MPYVNEADGIKAGDRVRFKGWTKPVTVTRDDELGIKVGDEGTVTRVFVQSSKATYDVDFPTQNRKVESEDIIYFPAEIEKLP
jgi:hypothetical protein